MNPQLSQWLPVAVILSGQTAVIVGGYVLGFYFQNRRLDDLRDSVNKRFDDLRDLLKFEVKRLEDRLIRLEHQSLIKAP